MPLKGCALCATRFKKVNYATAAAAWVHASLKIQALNEQLQVRNKTSQSMDSDPFPKLRVPSCPKHYTYAFFLNHVKLIYDMRSILSSAVFMNQSQMPILIVHEFAIHNHPAIMAFYSV